MIERPAAMYAEQTATERSAHIKDPNNYPMGIKRQILRLLSEAPTPEGQTPALECAIMLPCGQTIVGSLSITPDDVLRMMSPAADGKGNPGLIEQFFEYSQVAVIAIQRSITRTPSVIVRPPNAS
jgi:hypothetical protein